MSNPSRFAQAARRRIAFTAVVVTVTLLTIGGVVALTAASASRAAAPAPMPVVAALQRITSANTVTPTDEWVDFYSLASYYYGQPLPAGAVVHAYNPRGVQAGEFTVTITGWYGLLPVYRDDPNTPQDEGLLPGEEAFFTINGLSARPDGPDAPIWTANGEVKQVNLIASSVQPTHEWVNFYSQNTTLDNQLVSVGTLVEAFDPQGTKCGETIVSHIGWYGLLTCYRDDPNTSEDEGAVPGDLISFQVAGLSAAAVGPDSPTWTSNGSVRNVDLAAANLPTANVTVQPTDPVSMTLPNARGQIMFASGVVTTTTIFTYTETITPTQAAGGFAFAGRSFTLVATDAAGQPVTTFAGRYTITLNYQDSDWQNAGIPAEENLNLYYWNGTAWVAILPCDGCSLDTVNNQIIAVLDHLTEFALLGNPLAAPAVSGRKESNGVELHWTQTQAGVVRYEVYRSTNPYLTPADGQKLAPDVTPPGLWQQATYVDTAAFDPPLTNYYYVVVAVGAGEVRSLASNRVGAFHFGLTPGQ